MTTWTYGDLEVSYTRAPERVGAVTMILGVLGIIVAPLAITGWAVVRWFPGSLLGLVAMALAVGAAMYLSADEDLR